MINFACFHQKTSQGYPYKMKQIRWMFYKLKNCDWLRFKLESSTVDIYVCVCPLIDQSCEPIKLHTELSLLYNFKWLLSRHP